jgi:membrane-bound serine protease (ClpP class)
MHVWLAQMALFSTGSVGLVVLLIVLGLAALAAELLIIPGFGVAGIVGIALLVAGGVLAWMTWGAGLGIFISVGIAVVAIGFTVLLLRTRIMKKRFVLSTSLEQGGGTASADLTGLIGTQGEARSDLRPAGIAVIDNQRIDVVSEGGFIEQGTEIKVVAVDGPRVVVARNS